MSVVGDARSARPGLIEVFRVLKRRDSTVTLRVDRESAAEALLFEMQQWAPTTIWKAHGSSLRRLPPEEVDSLIADAIQALALAATDSNFNFRGLTEESARAWSRKVLVNHVSSELRGRQHRQNLDEEEVDITWNTGTEPACHLELASTDTRAERLDLAHAVTILRKIRARLFAQHRARDAETKMRAVWCYLAYLSGATVDEQVRSLSNEVELDGSRGEPVSSYQRRKNRVYKLRERGRRALHELLPSLETIED